MSITLQSNEDRESYSHRDHLRAFILDGSFPCVGAKSAVKHDRLTVCSARSLQSAWNDLEIQDRLMTFAWGYRQDPTLFTSFAVVFDGPLDLDEEAFELALWDRIQSFADKDAWRGQRHDPRVSADPADPHFSLSYGGEAFFVVGLHPNASRPARRFQHPTLVFNPHDQFETLRKLNRYEKLREVIIDRDIKLAGDANPMLARHGAVSEARQYSGRAVDGDWKCPFHRPPRATLAGDAAGRRSRTPK